MEERKVMVNEANEKLCVEVFAPECVKATIVFCHGITGCRKGRTMADDYLQVLARKLMGHNYKVVLFDFSGHGESEGNDYDVCLSKSTDELSRVFFQEVEDTSKVSFLAFSYGAAVLGNFLKQNPEINPARIVMYSPCFYPLESCFLNADSIFGKDIVKGVNSGEMAAQGYAVVGAKGFRFGTRMLEDCKDYSPDVFKPLHDRILVLAGTQDVILNTKLNEQFCTENNIELHNYVASHSLFEDIENVMDATINYFEM